MINNKYAKTCRHVEPITIDKFCNINSMNTQSVPYNYTVRYVVHVKFGGSNVHHTTYHNLKGLKSINCEMQHISPLTKNVAVIPKFKVANDIHYSYYQHILRVHNKL